MDYEIDLALNQVPGRDVFRRFGANLDIDVGSEDVWSPGAIRTDISAAGAVTVVSSSANDNAAGTGIRVINILYIDSALLEQNVTVTLNGTTPVNVGVNAYRIQRITTVSSGSGLVAAGNITCSIGGVLQSEIPLGFAQSRQTHYFMPVDKRGAIYNLSFSVTPGPVTFLLLSRNPGLPLGPWRERGAWVASVNSTVVPFVITAVQPGEELKIVGVATAVNQFCYASFSVVRESISRVK